MARTKGAVGKATAGKLQSLDKEVLVPLILKFFAANRDRIEFKLGVLRNSERFSTQARVRFDEFFTIKQRGGFVKNTKTRWSSKIAMNMPQMLSAWELLREYGYDKSNVEIGVIFNSTEIELDLIDDAFIAHL